MRIVPEDEFREAVQSLLLDPHYSVFDCVTGPGRSGAVAAVYASHILHIPFIPYGQFPAKLNSILIIDTATESGDTLKKAIRKYIRYNPFAAAVYNEPPRVAFWYESPKPQFYKESV